VEVRHIALEDKQVIFFSRKRKDEVEIEEEDYVLADTHEVEYAENKESNKHYMDKIVGTLTSKSKTETVDDGKATIKGVRKDAVDVVDDIISHFTQEDPIKLNLLERGAIKKEAFMEDVNRYISNYVSKVSAETLENIYKVFNSFVFGYDIVDELIADEDVSDIKIYRYEHIRVKKKERETSHVKFRSDEHFKRFIEHTVVKNKVSTSDQNAAQVFTDKKSNDKYILRFNVTTGFINSSEDYLLSIRKIPKTKYTREQFIEKGFFTAEQADYIEERVRSGHGVLIAGKGGSGKTFLMNYILDIIPHTKSGLVIQESEECFSDHPDLCFQHTVSNRGEGKIQYTLGDLARNGLIMDIDVFAIGEIKGAEALYLLNAVYTGAQGMATVHGASAEEALNKLADYIKYNSDYKMEDALRMLTHLDTIVFMKDFNMAEVAEVEGFDEEKKRIKYNRVF
jgi:pilus assembly protein CpaF